MKNIIKHIEKVLCFIAIIFVIALLFLFIITLIFIIQKIASLLIFFVNNHTLASYVAIFLIFLIYYFLSVFSFNKMSVKNHFKRRWYWYGFPVISFIIYMFINYLAGSTSSYQMIFSKVSPIKIEYENTGIFPFSKTLWRRFWFDLPLPKNKKPFASLHWYLRADFYKENGINESKELICILKNLGTRPLLLKKIDKLIIQRDDYIYDNYVFTKTVNKKEIRGLLEIYNYINTELEPTILYPSEEKIIIRLSPACTIEPLTIETEISYCEYQNESNSFIYYEKAAMNTARFKNYSSRILSARTIHYSNVINISQPPK